MCDKIEFEKLKDRMMALEKSQLVQGEQIKTLFRSSRLQFWTVWGITIILLLAVVYGALGPRGFNAVANAAPKVISQTAN